MFYINRKVKITAGIVFACMVVLGAMFIDNAEVRNEARMVSAQPSGFKVVIDAGHGGQDGGAVSRNGTKEAELNLKIAKELAKELAVRGVAVTMTRTNHESLASPFAKNRKRDDMEKRCALINKTAPDLVISIHLNNFASDRRVRGLQAFYTKGAETAKLYAEAVQAEFNRQNPLTSRNATTGDYYILNCTEYPSVLVECGFLSNAEEEKLLKTNEYQRILAHLIATAVTAASAQQKNGTVTAFL